MEASPGQHGLLVAKSAAEQPWIAVGGAGAALTVPPVGWRNVPTDQPPYDVGVHIYAALPRGGVDWSQLTPVEDSVPPLVKDTARGSSARQHPAEPLTDGPLRELLCPKRLVASSRETIGRSSNEVNHPESVPVVLPAVPGSSDYQRRVFIGSCRAEDGQRRAKERLVVVESLDSACHLTELLGTFQGQSVRRTVEDLYGSGGPTRGRRLRHPDHKVVLLPPTEVGSHQR